MRDKIIDLSKIINLIGHSIYHPDIDKILGQLDIAIKDKLTVGRYDSLKSTTFGTTLTFWYKEFYEEQIRPAQSIFKSKEEHEVLLYELTFQQIDKQDYILPFGLLFGDSAENVISKLGQKPFSKSKNFDGQSTWTFYTDLFEIMPVFDINMKLDWLRIWGIKSHNKKKIEFKNSLTLQNANINQDKVRELLELKNQKPTRRWTKCFHEGDINFNEHCIYESEQLLDKFIDDLVDTSKTKKASAIYSKVKNVVSGLNKLNKKYDGFIETLERDELVDFISKGTMLTGFKISESIDITEEMRQW